MSVGRIIGVGFVCAVSAGARAQICGAWNEMLIGGPSARYHQGMCFDSARGLMVLYGGSNGCPIGDTWEYDGDAWTHRTDLIGPSSRTDCALAFDPQRNQTVLFGGQHVECGGSVYQETWEYDGAAWALRSPLGVSPPHGGAMCYSAVDGGVVFLDLSGVLWKWDGSAWTVVVSDDAVSGSGSIVADTLRGVLVFITPRVINGQFVYNTYERQSQGWVLRQAAEDYPEAGAALSYSSELGRVVRYSSNISPISRLHTWSGSLWQEVLIPQPPHRGGGTFSYDESRQKFVLFGGHGAGGVIGDTWELQLAQSTLGVINQPDRVQAAVGASVHFEVEVSASMPVEYQWRKDGIDLSDDDRISGSDTPVLRIDGVRRADAGLYSVVVRDDCGQIQSENARLTVVCPADFNSDGFLDFFDYDDFVTCFEINSCPPSRTADFNGDAFVDFFDYDDFVRAFEIGC